MCLRGVGGEAEYLRCESRIAKVLVIFDWPPATIHPLPFCEVDRVKKCASARPKIGCTSEHSQSVDEVLAQRKSKHRKKLRVGHLDFLGAIDNVLTSATGEGLSQFWCCAAVYLGANLRCCDCCCRARPPPPRAAATDAVPPPPSGARAHYRGRRLRARRLHARRPGAWTRQHGAADCQMRPQAK